MLSVSRGALTLLVLVNPAAFEIPASAASPSCSDAGTGLRFDGIDDCFTIPFDASFPTAVFTLAAWVRLNDPAGDGGLVVRGEDDTSDNLPWALLDIGHRLAVQLEDGQDIDSVYQSQAVVDDGQWHHVAATRSSDNSLVLYVDGSEVGEFQNTLVPSSNNSQTMTIGCYIGADGGPRQQPPGDYATGLIEDVSVWNRAFSAQEIRGLYSHPPGVSDSGLVGFWRFDEGAGQIGQDASPEGNHGTCGFGPGVGVDDPSWDTYIPAVVDLRIRPTELFWFPPPRVDDTYDVVRGNLRALNSTHGDFTTSTDACLTNNQDGTTLNESATPLPGHGFWYLVRRVIAGASGTYDPCDPSQVGSSDVEIAASGLDCAQ